MDTIHRMMRAQVDAWIAREQDNNSSLIYSVLTSIQRAAKLRPPQVEAIEVYLWIKFVGKNQKLSHMVKTGLLHNTDHEYRDTFAADNYIAHFLSQFFTGNGLRNLQQALVKDPCGEQTDWRRFVDELLHDYAYPNYLFSLPMGAGKTYLMACFIYLDLYFAKILKDDPRFARNFVVFAPHAAKTAILPSLRTIKDFNPEWILPPADARALKQTITFEILDSLSSKRRDKLHGNNPNLEKVNRLKQSKDFGLVFITNAEKVVLEKISDADQAVLAAQQSGQDDMTRAQADLVKTNELRERLALIPHLGVLLDEVHHAYKSNGGGEKKLRQAVGVLNQHNNVNAVIGFSGTPYAKTKITVASQPIKLNQIQDIVYNYPLNIGIGKFLKTPIVKSAAVAEGAFLENALSEFFTDYDREYANGTVGKIAFYCPSIAQLNEEILPVIQQWYAKHRPGKEAEIFRYYSKSNGKDKDAAKKYALPKDSLSIFNNLDKPHARQRVILLVAVGKEGWDCRSLTAVVLPRQKTSKNFVLQTTCRCLREVTDAANERALIYLSSDNYQTLDAELRENYRLQISDITDPKQQGIPVQVRKPRLGKLAYKQIKTQYKIAKTTQPDIVAVLAKFAMADIKKKHAYDPAAVQSEVGKDGLVKETSADYDSHGNQTRADVSYRDFLRQLSAATYGFINESELTCKYDAQLRKAHRQIAAELEWLALHPNLKLADIIKHIVSGFMQRVEYAKDVITEDTEIQLLEWEGGAHTGARIPAFTANEVMNKLMPKMAPENVAGNRGYIAHPEYMEEDFFSASDNCDPQDISYNYTPYKMDSAFEQVALAAMLKLTALKDLELYFNGYKDQQLQSFWIQTPHGRYTPDFLILKRQNGVKYTRAQTTAIDKILIIETKGKVYNTPEFQAKAEFVKGEFLRHNPNFTYQCFVDAGNNDFGAHLTELTTAIAALNNGE